MENTMGMIETPVLEPYTPFETRAQYGNADEDFEIDMELPENYQPPVFLYKLYFSREEEIPPQFGIFYKMTREWLSDNADEWGLPEWIWQKPWKYLDENKMEIFGYGKHSKQKYENMANLTIHGLFNELKHRPNNYGVPRIFNQRWLPRLPKPADKYSTPFYSSRFLTYNFQHILKDICDSYGIDDLWIYSPRYIIMNFMADYFEENLHMPNVAAGVYGDMIDDSIDPDGLTYYQQEVLELTGVLV